jgi:formylmethanofuran dehydrogenase subunit E
MKLIQCKKCSEVFEEEEIVINKKKDYYCRICFYEDYEKSLNKK